METNKLVDVSALKELPKLSNTALVVLKDLATRERNSRQTDIDRNAMKLLYKGIKVNPDDYLNFWKNLESLGVGNIIWGRNGNPNRFRWHYSLKDVAIGAINPDSVKELLPAPSEVDVVVPKRSYKRRTKRSKRGRPLGSKNKPKAFPKPSQEVICITVKDLNGKAFTVSVQEAMRIVEQMNIIKELAKAA